MSEEIIRTGKDELEKEIKELNDLTKKSFEDIINEKLELDSNFNLQDLTDEEKSTLTKEDIESYDIGKKLFDDKEKVINPFDIIPSHLLDEADKEVIAHINDGTISPEKIEEFKDTLRQQYIMLAFSVYNKINQDHFSEEVSKISNETLPDDVVNYYFNTMSKAYCFNPEDLSVSYEEGKENTLERNKAFATTITMSRMIQLSTDPVFLNKLTKQSEERRYNRHIENLNFILAKKLKTNEKSATTTVNQLESEIRKTFFGKFKYSINGLNAQLNGVISKAYVIAMDEIAKKSFSNQIDFVEIYFYNINMNMLAQSTSYSNLTGSAKIAYENTLEFITNIYNYFSDKKQ